MRHIQHYLDQRDLSIPETEEQPKPCPFCGSSEVVATEACVGKKIYQLRCNNCDAWGPESISGTHAIEAWNHRA